MPRIITERFVRRSVINFLARKGWDRGLREKETAEHGVDIKVRHNKYARYFFIETKGESSSKSAESAREVAFVYSLGQVITRMKAGAARYYYGLGLPASVAKIAVRRIPWQVANKLLLYIFSVDGKGKVKQYHWRDLKKIQ
ncbi:MAG: hypothetical protein NC923_00600 [Candidatus Omnitrophica bacterium]|nr:hypothetical protein [Candidatus Omnitrophota bacterium]